MGPRKQKKNGEREFQSPFETSAPSSSRLSSLPGVTRSALLGVTTCAHKTGITAVAAVTGAAELSPTSCRAHENELAETIRTPEEKQLIGKHAALPGENKTAQKNKKNSKMKYETSSTGRDSSAKISRRWRWGT